MKSRTQWYAALLVVALATTPLARAAMAQEKAEQAKTKVVQVIVNFGDGFEMRYTQVPWKTGMTVLDAMNFAKKHRRGLDFKFRGQGETAFLYEIESQENEGARGNNWIYRVNKELADKSFGICSLQSGDVVLWTFGEYP